MLIAAQGDFTKSYRINYGDRSSNRLRNAREHIAAHVKPDCHGE